jgi:NAD-reducing hydrogenase small subunit
MDACLRRRASQAVGRRDHASRGCAPGESRTCRAAADPAADLLPTASPSRYPTDVLRQRILAEPLDPAAYRIDDGRFTIAVMTPVHAAKAHAAVERAQAANRHTRRGMSGVGPADTFDDPYYDWYRNTPALDRLVTFEIEPGIGSKTRSRWARFAARVSGALLGTPHAPARHVEFTSVRRRSRFLVSFGDCATTGNVTAMRNRFSLDEIVHRAYVELAQGDPTVPAEFTTIARLLPTARPLHEFVRVDAFLHGCPPTADEIWLAVSSLIEGRVPDLPNVYQRYG